VDHHTPELRHLPDGPALVWDLPRRQRCVSSAPLGGGIGARRWIVNLQVPIGYDRLDPEVHVAATAHRLGCRGTGIGLLTAADVTRHGSGHDAGVSAIATVGLGMVTWAAAADGAWSPWRPGTINLVVFVPVALGDAALVNSVVTITEAKTQALLEAGVPGTGTASDAVVVCCPEPTAGRPEVEAFGGPRSRWGSRLARAAHRAVAEGIDRLQGPSTATGVRAEPSG
jgi:adenosylcobinamide amidohydrolase